MTSQGSTTAVRPLTAAQREVWFAQQLLGPVPLTTAQYVDVRGPLDLELYGRAGRRAARDLGAYMRFHSVDGQPGQVLDDEIDDHIAVVDCGGEADPAAAALAWMRADQVTPFELGATPAIVSTILRLSHDHHLLYTRAHHLALDGFGAIRMYQLLGEHYTALLAGDEISSAPVDSTAVLAAAEASYLSSRRAETDREYWRARLGALPDPVTLATRPGDPDPLPIHARAELPETLVAQLRSRGEFPGIAPVLVAAFAAFLGRLTDTDTVALSLPVTARTSAALRACAGMTSNIVPLCCGGETVGTAIAGARAELSGALRHQRYRGADMVRDSGRQAQSLGFGPAVNIMNFHTELALGQARGTIHLLSTGPVDDLALNVYPVAETGLRIEFEANRNRYTEAEVTAHLHRFTGFLAAFAAADDEVPVGQLPALTETEAQLLVPWRGPRAHTSATLAELIAAAVAANPDGTAVVYGEKRWTYREFDAWTDRLAGALQAAGAGPETLVAMVMERSAASVGAIWAIAKTGAGFVPIDVGYPAERIGHILGDCGATLGVTGVDHPADLPDSVTWTVVDPDAPPVAELAPVPARPAHPAYLIYTSGSTGVPKGVLVTHGGLANLAAERRDRYALRPGARTLHHASPGFDMAVGEILCGLAGAATLVVAPRYVMAGPDLAELIRRERLTNAIITPAVLATLDPETLPELRVLGVGGEAIRPDLVAAWSRTRLMRNGYGPTEATDIATIAELTPDRAVTIGAPLRGFHALVLDARLRPVPPGVIGELYIGGPALARGYHGRHALTAGRFVADPFGPPGGRVYRTGDLVTITPGPDPELIYHGRSDFQIKVRGHRIEPGEIETTLTGLPGVDQAAVIAHQDARGTHLVAYLVPDGHLDVERVRGRLADLLPAYLRPSAYVVLDTLPLTPNGKLDTRRLPAPVFGHQGSRPVATDAERTVAAAFGDLLGTDVTGADMDFFELGGTSLTATALAARLGVGVRTVFDAPTVAALALRLPEAGDQDAPAPQPRPARLAPAPAQLRMWLLNQLYPDSAAYHLPIALRLSGPLDVPALAAAVRDVVDRHEVLRTVYPDTGAGPQVRIMTADEVLGSTPLSARALDAEAAVGVASVSACALDADVALGDASASAGALDPEVTLGDVPSSGRVPDLAAELAALVTAPFDVTADAPIRVALWRFGADEHVLALVAHHIAADGWSHGPLMADLSAAYTARADGQRPGWEPLPLQYADYTLWQHRRLGDRHDPESTAARQLAHWVRALDGAADRPPLPADRVRTPGSGGPGGGRGAVVEFEIAAETASALATLARSHNATPFMAGYAAFTVLLGALAGTTDVTVGTPVAGRGHPALDRLVGMFVNTLPLRLTFDPQDRFAALLARAREVSLAALDHADVPFDHIVEAVNPPRDTTRHPLFDAVFSYENLPDVPALELGELTVSTLDISWESTHFDLALTLREQPGTGGLAASLRYATDLYDAATVTGVAARFRDLLATIAVRPEATIAQLSETTGRSRSDATAAGVSDIAGHLRSDTNVAQHSEPTGHFRSEVAAAEVSDATGVSRPDATAAESPVAPESSRPDQPVPDIDIKGDDAEATVRELAVARVFADVLERDSVEVDDSFFELGGTSLLVFTLRAELRTRLGIDADPRLLFEAPTPRAVTAAVTAEAGAAAAGNWTAMLTADAVLDPAITVPADFPAPPIAATEVFLTGATGFVGIHLLRELLDRTSARVWCLVRAEDADAVRRRLGATLERYGLGIDGLADRVVPVPGDLAAPRFGLTPEDWTELAVRIEAIYHNGAKVNHLDSYESLRPANVAGTVEILRLAVETRVKALHFVSTVSAAVGAGHTGVVTEQSAITAAEVPRNGYLATKWVAEQLVLAAAGRGLPVAVYRPGLVAGSIGGGAISADDAFWTLIRSAAHLGVAPDIESADVTLAPVDYVAGALVVLATGRHPDSAIYHLVNSAPTNVGDILNILRRSGFPVETVSVAEAADRLAGQIAAHADLMRAALVADNYLNGGGDALLVDDTGTRAVLAASGVHCPPIDDAVLQRYIDGFITAGLLPAPVPDRA
ncbi:amino acid adenylation domain-containing protein [Nocardia rhizosphaerae]|uniref:Amino acid adenylation domain-containing protein n=1 Tax=Nocardia rhizosphaerae TaxID=1691571 RepID=A0ABV8L679_9NOCA